MSKKKLFDQESEDEEVSFKTENEYAKKYDMWREKEELHKLEQKYGSKALDSDASLSSDSEDESDETPELSEEMEKQFLKTLSLLKNKDPRIYDPNFKFFKEQEDTEKKPKVNTLSFADTDDEDDDDDGNIFRVEKVAPEVKSLNNKEADSSKVDLSSKDGKEDKLKEYLTGKVDKIDDEVEQDLAPLKALWSDPKLNEGEAFLRDYILNKRYLEEGDAGEAEDKIRDDEDLEADEKIVEEQGKFERAYNFRFEEPDEEYLKRFPRTMNYIRPKDDRRSRKRAEVRARKEEEKKKKMDEIARLKALKLKEIQEKILKIKEVTGNDDLAFKEEDIEGDFDPEEHDRRMKALFDEEYYDGADEEKPVFPDLDEELEIENWEKYEGECLETSYQEQGDDGPHCEDEEFNMDADYNPKAARAQLLQEMEKNLGKKRRNRKKKSKLAQLLATEKPKFVPTVADKTYAEYMEEYYKMDCEDVIGGDLPTRFKYREVVPNDYGLTIEEILLADDKELTQWVPLKKIVKHRPDNVEKGEVKTYAQKAADMKLKRKVLPSLFKDLPEEPEIVVPIEELSKKKKKKNKKKDEEEEHENVENVNENRQNEVDNTVNTDEVNIEIDTEVVRKKEKKHKKAEAENTANSVEINGENNVEHIEEGRRKKKKKQKDSFIIDNIQNEGPSQASHEHDNNLKRKLETEDNQIPNKKKKKKKNKASVNEQTLGKTKVNSNKDFKKPFKQKGKFKSKQNDNTSDNPLGKLSDERLKAYGLNPKKYRSFLKYKKF